MSDPVFHINSVATICSGTRLHSSGEVVRITWFFKCECHRSGVPLKQFDMHATKFRYLIHCANAVYCCGNVAYEHMCREVYLERSVR